MNSRGANKAVFLFILLSISIELSALPHTGADFLKITSGPRAQGMAETGSAMSQDSAGVSLNPASLAASRNEIYFFYSPTFAGDAYLGYFGANYRVGKLLAINFNYVRYEIQPIPVTDEQNNSLGELTWVDHALTLNIAKKINDFSIGFGIKQILRQEYNPIYKDTTGRALAVDFGLIYRLPFYKNIRLGFAYRNLGEKVIYSNDPKSDPLPENLKLGLFYQMYKDQENSLKICIDGEYALEDTLRPSVGIEYMVLGLISLRAGYFNKEGNITGINYGLGFYYRSFGFDLASLNSGPFARTNIVSLYYRFQ